MPQHVVQLTSSPEVIGLVRTIVRDQNLRSSEPAKMQSAVDTLDSAINPEVVRQTLEMMKISFQTGTAALAFFAALTSLLKSKGLFRSVIVADNANPAKRIVVDSQSPEKIVSDLAGHSTSD